MGEEVGTWDSVLLENLSEESFMNNIYQRYKHDRIYTYIGTSVVAVNPYCHTSVHSSNIMSNYGSRGIFQLPPHIYGLTNLAYESLIHQKEDQCVLLTGESGSGKTESFKMIVHFLTQIQDKSRIPNTTEGSHNQSIIKNGNATCRSISCSTAAHVIKTGSYHKPQLDSNGCTIGSNVSNIVRHCKSNVTLSTRRQSSSPDATTKQSRDMIIVSRHAGERANSSDRYSSKRRTRDKIVDFDFSRHKSIENFSTYDKANAVISNNNALLPSAYEHDNIINRIVESPLLDIHSTKPCFKQQQFHPICRNNQLSQFCCTTITNTPPATTNTKCTPTQLTTLSPQLNINVNASPKIRICSNCQVDNNSPRRNSVSTTSIHLQCDNCKNSFSQHSVENHNERLPRVSLNDAYKIHQKLIKQSKSQRHSLSTSSFISFRQQREPLKYIRQCVSYADVFLEAMGNAVTLKNTNASRYGKLFDIEIDFKGDLMGVHIIHYMLDKTRVTDCSSRIGDRNFHIFYQLLLGGDLQFLKSLKLHRNIEKYAILRNTTAVEEDRLNFHYTKKSLETLGLTSDDINDIFRIIAAVLKLGNLIFMPITNIDGTEGCHVSNNYEVQEIGHLLHMEAQILTNCLTRTWSLNNSTTNTNTIESDTSYELNARQASNIRDTLCRTLYDRLFTWLVNKINELLKSEQREKRLAILDFYGFENLEYNTFEQFTINYSAEKIHQQFIKCALRLEQELYINEGLEWVRLDYFDNESICELIDKPNYGILSLMNETHLTTNDALLQRIQQCCAGHTNFMICGSNAKAFRIRHFASVVNYSICGFLEKNIETLPKYITSAFYQSKLSVIKHLFPEGNPKRQVNKKPSTVSSNIRTQLQTLLAIIQSRCIHYVFCIKPNEHCNPGFFDVALVQHQIRYMSLIPFIRLCRAGYCYNTPHRKFFIRYKLLNSITWPHYPAGENIITGVAIIIRNLPLPSAEFTIGIKNVFIRSPRTFYELEQFRKARIVELVTLIQKVYRMYRARKQFMLKRQSQIIISNAWRTWKAQDDYRNVKYKHQTTWAVDVIAHHYRQWKIRQFLMTILLRLPPNTMSPLSMDWPSAPLFLKETSHLLHSIYHRWKCYVYRNMFDQTARNRMREKVTASIIFKNRKASYPSSVAQPFIGDYLRLRHNQLWRDMCVKTHDQYVVFADIINKITRSNGKISPILLVISTSSLLLLDQRTLQIKYRIPATEIYRMSLSPYLDNIAVFHIRASEFGCKKGDFIFQTCHIIEIVTKMFLVVQNATGKPPEIHISTEFQASFGQQTVIFNFKCNDAREGGSDNSSACKSGASCGLPKRFLKITRKPNRMEIIV